jgi:hypothetical protein
MPFLWGITRRWVWRVLVGCLYENGYAAKLIDSELLGSDYRRYGNGCQPSKRASLCARNVKRAGVNDVAKAERRIAGQPSSLRSAKLKNTQPINDRGRCLLLIKAPIDGTIQGEPDVPCEEVACG